MCPIYVMQRAANIQEEILASWLFNRVNMSKNDHF